MSAVTPHQRVAQALRDLATAYEEANCGRKKARRRGLLPLDVPREIPADVQQSVDHRLAANGYRSRR